jgi:hypothetical protein
MNWYKIIVGPYTKREIPITLRAECIKIEASILAEAIENWLATKAGESTDFSAPYPCYVPGCLFHKMENRGNRTAKADDASQKVCDM